MRSRLSLVFSILTSFLSLKNYGTLGILDYLHETLALNHFCIKYIFTHILWVPLSSTPPTLSSTHQFRTKGPLLFSPKNPQFHTKKPLVQHTSQFHTKGLVELSGYWCGTEGFRYWTVGFLVWNWGFFWCWKGVVLVWNRCVELRGSVWNWGVLIHSK